MPRRLLSAAAACTLLLGLASCGEAGDGPVTTPPPEIDISAPSDGGGDTGTSDDGGDEGDTNAAPDVPAPDPADYPGMDENTEEGAQQFTRYFFALLIWGYQTGNADEIETKYTEGCGVCSTNVEKIHEYQSAGVYWSESTIEDVTLEGLPVVDDEFDVAVHYEAIVGEHSEPSLSDGTQNDLPSTQFVFEAGLVWTDEGWVLDGASIDVDAA